MPFINLDWTKKLLNIINKQLDNKADRNEVSDEINKITNRVNNQEESTTQALSMKADLIKDDDGNLVVNPEQIQELEWDKIASKPFEAYPKSYTTVLPKTDIKFSMGSISYNKYYFKGETGTPWMPLEVGKKYLINIGGSEFVQEYTGGDLGASSLAFAKYPFRLVYDSDAGLFSNLYVSTKYFKWVYFVSISEYDFVRPISDIYLSDNIATTTYVDTATSILKPITTAGTSTAYTATVNGITSLTVGTQITIIPHVVSASTTPTLNVNNLGAKQIRRRLSSIATAPTSGYSNTWLAANKPFTVKYDGTYWITEDNTKPVAADLYGTLSVEKGGTGATTAEAARTNLGIVDIPSVTTSDNGKFLRVVDGAWAAVAIDNAEGVRF